VGKFGITRIRPGDQALWERMNAEAFSLCREYTPRPQAIAALIALAGDNPRAFKTIGGKRTRGLHRTPEGQEVLRLLADAAIEFNKSGR
jgi:hypothetical protein